MRVHSEGATGLLGVPGSPPISEDGVARGVDVAKDRVDRDEEDLVRLYLTDIGQYNLLTKDDEVRLAQQIERGNEAQIGRAHV